MQIITNEVQARLIEDDRHPLFSIARSPIRSSILSIFNLRIFKSGSSQYGIVTYSALFKNFGYL